VRVRDELNRDCAAAHTFVYNIFGPLRELFVRKSLSIIASLILAAIPVAAARAQRDALVRVRVVDSAGAPIANAEVSALRGLTTVVAGGPTDSLGRRSFLVPQGGGYEVVARRIGYQRGEQFFSAIHDSVGIRIVLRAAPANLPAVSVTAKEDIKRRAYHVDADDIATSKRPIIDGLDVLTKLRPDIIYTRIPGCALQYVWVNGTRIVFPAINPGLAAKARQARRAALATPHIGPTGLATVNLTVQSVMASIHPEHIEEVNFADCNDTSVDRVKGNSALYVTLKPGIGFDRVIGSYVVENNALAPNDRAAVNDAAMNAAPAAYRNRLLGVFDEETGEPVPGVEVADSTSGTFATTTPTGTVSLLFLPEGISTLILRKAGYTPLRFPIVISPKDTLPITLTLAKPK